MDGRTDLRTTRTLNAPVGRGHGGIKMDTEALNPRYIGDELYRFRNIITD